MEEVWPLSCRPKPLGPCLLGPCVLGALCPPPTLKQADVLIPTFDLTQKAEKR